MGKNVEVAIEPDSYMEYIMDKTMEDAYYDTLKEIAKYDSRLTVKKWTNIAKEKKLLSAVTLRTMSGLTWAESCKKAKELYGN